MLITGKEKAVLGGLVAFLTTMNVQIQQAGQLTLKEFAWSVGAYVVTHVTVWAATNTPPKTPLAQ